MAKMSKEVMDVFNDPSSANNKTSKKLSTILVKL